MATATAFADISDGDQLNQGYFNGITRMKTVTFTSAAEQTATADSTWYEFASTSISNGANALLTSTTLKGEIDVVGGNSQDVMIRLEIVGDTLGTYYFLRNFNFYDGGNSQLGYASGWYTTAAANDSLFTTDYNIYSPYVGNSSEFVALPDATTTAIVYFKGGAADTCKLKNMTLKLTYVNTYGTG